MLDQADELSDDKTQVLVVDDDPIMRKLIAAQIGSRKVIVSEAEDGAVAWRALNENTYDLALIDLDMPGLNGFDLMRCMRGHPKTKHMAIVVITSHGDNAALEQALQIGATSYIVKPVTWSTFKPHIENLLLLAGARKNADARITEYQEAMLTRDKMFSNISHDLTTTLDNMQTLKSRLVSTFKTDRAKDCAVLLANIVQQMQRVQEQISSSNRVQSSQLVKNDQT